MPTHSLPPSKGGRPPGVPDGPIRTDPHVVPGSVQDWHENGARKREYPQISAKDRTPAPPWGSDAPVPPKAG